MQPTEAQRTAIYTHDKSLIVVAGAGSGKTRVLVERFLALLDANPDWPLNALVAITFTRKAAGEMRDRVRKGIEKRLREANSSPTQAHRWADLLAAMDSARINTIHGLCADLLRANAAEAGLDPEFTVLDEADSALLCGLVVDDLLAEIASEDTPENAHILTLFDVYEEYTVRNVLANPLLFSVDLPDFPPDLMAHWRVQWEDGMAQLVRDFCKNADFCAAVEIAQQLPWPMDDKLTDVWSACVPLIQALQDVQDISAGYSALSRLNSVIDLRGGAAKKWGDALAEAKAVLGTLRETARNALKTIGDPPDELDEQAAQLLPAWRALLHKLQVKYRKAKDDQIALDFDDLEKYTVHLLTQNAAVAARYCGKEFRHLLVDEFQDTNEAQWQIARSLAADLKDLFVVGDPKQSIYAFRGADVRVFERVRREIVAAGGDPVSLAESFRSHAPLVERFNTLFNQILSVQEDSPVRDFQVTLGEPLRAYRQTPPNTSPPLTVMLIDPNALSAEDKLKTEDCRQWEAYELARRIQEMVAAGNPVYDREQDIVRPVGYGDFAMLFRSLVHVGLYEDALRAAGVPFITIAGRGYYGRQEVHDLLNLLSALHNPADNLVLAAALRSPLFNLSDDALYALRLTGLPLWQALDQPGDKLPPEEAETVEFAKRTLYRLHDSAGRVSISELLRDVLAATGYLATITGLPDGAQRRGNVEKLLEKAQTSGKIRLGAFQYYLRDLSEREVREGDAALDVEGVVRIMTVHASKGLEFPVVILGDTSWKQRTSSSADLIYSDGLACRVIGPDGKFAPTFAYRRALALETARDDAENRRLLYVAMTRAQDTLIVSGQAERDEEANFGWTANGWLGWVLDALPPHDDPSIEVVIPHAPPEDDTRIRTRRAKTAWESDEVRDRQPFKGSAQPPRLLPAVRIRRQDQARHLAATSVADLGSATLADTPDERRVARDRFRRKIFYDAPDVIRPALNRTTSVKARHVGDIVHEALRYWRFPSDNDDTHNQELRKMLLSIAWKQGITHKDEADRAVWLAQTLLFNFKRSTLYNEITNAAEVYRELPFIYEHDSYIVHGVIDLLFRRPDDTWALVDYKTSVVNRAYGESPNQAVSLDQLREHARRYHLQIGVYANAVRRQLGGITPDTMIHYVRYTTVPIPAEAWQAALAEGLGTNVSRVVED